MFNTEGSKLVFFKSGSTIKIHSRKLIQAIVNVLLLARDKCDLVSEGCLLLKLAIVVYVPAFKMIKLKIVFVLGLGDIFSSYLNIYIFATNWFKTVISDV